MQRSVGFGRGILFCRWLSPEALGQWEMAFSFLLLASPLVVLGVPGSFGRYAEQFRQRGQLRTFLRRASVWTAVCCALGAATVATFAGPLAELAFGSRHLASLMRCLATCLCLVILHHTIIQLLGALRLFRIVSAMNLAHSALFAAISLALLCVQPTAHSILVGYGAACAITSAGALAWTWPELRRAPLPSQPLPHAQFWPKLLRFAFFVWVTNLLTHIFAVVDRYMIVHFSGLSPAVALEQVGNYHSSRIVPLLIVSVADLLSGLLLPHLSHDWEAGRRRRVSRRLNASFKLTTLGMLAFGGCVLACGPLLFDRILQGRYDAGLAVLPWALAGCVWYGVHLIAQTYLWCAEKTRLATVPLVVGLAINVALNLALLPLWGLYGAVLATAVGAGVCTLTSLALSQRQGMQVDRGTWIVALAPAALGGGMWYAGAALAAALAMTLLTELVLSSDDRQDIAAMLRHGLSKYPLLRRRRLLANA